MMKSRHQYEVVTVVCCNALHEGVYSVTVHYAELKTLLAILGK